MTSQQLNELAEALAAVEALQYRYSNFSLIYVNGWVAALWGVDYIGRDRQGVEATGETAAEAVRRVVALAEEAYP